MTTKLEPLIAAECRCGWISHHLVSNLAPADVIPCYCGKTAEVDVRLLIEARELSVRLKEKSLALPA